MHHLNDVLEELVELLHDLLRGVVDGEGGGADDVDKQHCHLAVLTAQLRAFLQGALCHLSADIAAEDIAHALALTQAAHHLVETGLENTELGAVVDVHLDVVLAAAHAVDGVLQLQDRIHHTHHSEHGADKPRTQRRDAQCDDGRDDIGGIGGEHPHLLAQVHQDDADERDAGGHEPRGKQPVLNRRLQGGILEAACHGLRRHGAHEALRLQVGQEHDEAAGQSRRNAHDDGQPRRVLARKYHRQKDAHQPDTRGHPGLVERDAQDQVAHHIGIVVIGTALPVQHRPEQPQGHRDANDDGEGHE